MRTIELVELEGVELSDIPGEVLRVLMSTGGFRVSDGKLIPRTVAGFVRVGEWRVIIRPRLEASDFMRILFSLGMATDMQDEGFDGVHLFEEMALFYLMQLRRALLTHGPPRAYRPRIREGLYVRGKVERIFPHRIRQKVWEMGPVPRASLLLRAARIAASVIPERGFYLLREIEALMGAVEEGHNSDFTDIPRDEPYRSLVLLARTILEGGGIHTGHGSSPSFSFFVNTARLFEFYALKTLSREFDVEYQRSFSTDGFVIRPDFVIGRIPADAKYRFSMDNSDIYQAISYAVILGSDRVFLLYPYLQFQINISCCKIMGVGVLVHDAIEKLKKEVQDA